MPFKSWLGEREKQNMKYLSWMAVILWMSLIFYLSHQPAAESSKLSDSVTEIIIDTIEKVAPQVKIEKSDLQHIVRKNAHFMYFLILGILTLNALKLNRVSGYRGILLALLICILYAVSDEVHQIFVPGRSGEIRDVVIDCSGAGMGVLAYSAVSRIVKRMHSKKDE
jgi:VanZ family protein